MLKFLLPIIFIGIIAYILLCIFMYLMQGRLLFFPPKPYPQHYEKLAQNITLENIQIETKNGNTLDGWKQRDPNKKYILLYFGWNGEETSYFVEKYQYKSANIISFNYRSYGRSTGKASEKVLFSDALEIYDTLVEDYHIDPKNIILMGRSLGAGVATYLSSQRSVKEVILVTPYDSIESLAKAWYPLIPVSLLLRNKFDSRFYAVIRSNRLLCISGGKDTIIPNHHTENLLKYWSGSIQKIFIPEATHEDILDKTELIEGIDQFISPD